MDSLRVARSESAPEQQLRFRRLMLMAALACAAGIIVLVAVVQFIAWRNTVANATRRVNSAAASIVRLTDLQVASTEGPLQALIEVARNPQGDLATAVARVKARHPELDRLVVLDANGHVLAGSDRRSGDDWSRVTSRPAADLGGIALRLASSPEGSDGASLRVVAALPLQMEGHPAAWVGAQIAPSTIRGNLLNSPFGATGAFEVFDRDGVLVTRTGEGGVQAVALGRDWLRHMHPGQRLPRDDGDGRFYGSGSSSHFGYAVFASMSRADALGMWSSQAWPALAGMVLLLGLIAVGSRHVLRAQGRQAELVAFLLRQAEQLDNVQRIGDVGLWELDLASGRLAWSGEAAPILGLAEGERVNTIAGYLARVHPHDRQDVSSWFWQCMHQDGPFECEYRVIRANGDVAFMHLRARRQGEGGGQRRIEGTIREVTTLRHTQARLRESESQYRFLFDHSPLPAWVFDMQSHAVLAVNDAAVATYGYEREAFLRLRIEALRPTSEPPQMDRAVDKPDAGDRANPISLHRDREGRLLHMRCSGSEIEFAGRAAQLVVGMDFTAKVAAERELASSNARFQMLARATNDAVFDMDLVTGDAWWSEAFYAGFGYARKEDNGFEAWCSRVHPDDRERIVGGLNEFFAGSGVTWAGAYRLRRKDGSYADVFGRAYALRDDNGKAVRTIGGMMDQTAIVATRAALAESEESYHGLLAHMPLPLLLLRNGNIAYANLLAEELLGSAGQLVGASVYQYIDGDLRHVLDAPDLAATRIDAQVSPPGRSPFEAELSVSLYRDAIGSGVQVIIRDVTDQRHYEQKLNYQAMHDELTGLPNRRALHDAVSAMITQAWEDSRQLMLLFIDLDHFKYINDALGHLVGDEVLCQVSSTLRQAVGPSGYVARFGGDEFVAVVPCNEADGVVPPVIPALKAAIERPLMVAGMQQHLSCSIGVAYLGIDGDDANTLIRNADTAMYHAKRMGRHTWRRYSAALHDTALARLAVVSRLTEEALDDELELHYQTQHRGVQSEVFGVEALLRWPSGPGELSRPNVLVPLLEETGSIVNVGRWVLRQACRDQAAISSIMGHPVCMAVNLSAFQLAHDDLIGLVRDVLDETGVEPRYLELELTESAFLTEPERAIETLRKIKALGVTIALDDFGTGFSSLNYLSRMPIDKLKIDRSFVSKLPHDRTDGALCESILFLANSLDLLVIAEGVETSAQRRWLLDHGCQAMQGFLFAKPLPLDQLQRAVYTV
ncbi:bifunctional diguanylate cyclase/phosphodiesterase [Pinirhizobacter soli]|uniref:bifunctional diguanylate cyclase/phosphodiesterase n=1 Tax=Pinirhizobacter soli TaxID=2786953 RepID=UPI002029D743|nr:EAL domain-containing protein [Pinirhizobacter soli]